MCTFGGNHDLHICDQGNTNNSSYSNLGNAYEIPAGKSNYWLSGAYNFKIIEIEVFTVKFL